MHDLTYIIPCHNIESKGYILDCIASMKKLNIDNPIVVVDSASPDKSYMDKIKAPNITILDIENKNYAFGALWKGIEAVDSAYYALVHDSCTFNTPIDPSVYQGQHFVPFYRFHNQEYSASQKYRDWIVKQVQDLCNYQIIDTTIGTLFGIFVASKKYLTKLKEDNFDKILPTEKMQAVYCDEVAWSLAAMNNGIDLNKAYYYKGYSVSNIDIFTKYSGAIQKRRR